MVSEYAVFGNPLKQEKKMTPFNQKGLETKIPGIAKTKSSHFPLPPAGMIQNMIHVNSMSRKRKVEDKRLSSENIRIKVSQATTLPMCIFSKTGETFNNDIHIEKAGTRVNTLFSSHNWGTKR